MSFKSRYENIKFFRRLMEKERDFQIFGLATGKALLLSSSWVVGTVNNESANHAGFLVV